MKDENKSFAYQLAKQTKTHHEWLAVMLFGLQTLVKDEPTLVDCIVLECEKQAARGNIHEKSPVAYFQEIIDELGLKLTV